MNVSASKVMLVLALTAYTALSWGHLTSEHEKLKPEAKPARELTAAIVNRTVALSLARDPFDSIPLDRTAIAAGVLPGEPEKQLGELTLQGVFISLGRRVAVINGKPLHEGEIGESAPGGPLIRARHIGMDHVVVEGGGGVMTLRLSDARKPGDKAAANARGTGTGGGGTGTGGARGLASIRTEDR